MKTPVDTSSTCSPRRIAKWCTVLVVVLIFSLTANARLYDTIGSFFYILIVVIAGMTGSPGWVRSVAMACAALTMLTFEMLHGFGSAYAQDACLGTVFAICVVAFLVIDNKDKKQALFEQRHLLFRSQFLLEHTQRLGSVGSIVFSFPSFTMQFSPQAKKIFAFQSQHAPQISDLLKSIHTDDHERVLHTVQELSRPESAVDVEFRVTQPDRKTKIVRLLSRRSGSKHFADEAIVILIDVTLAHESEDNFQQRQSEVAQINRIMTFNEIIGSIAHEVNQPLAAVVTSAESGLRWLDRPSPDIAEANLALLRVVEQADRASAFLKTLRGRSLDRLRQAEPICIRKVFNSAHCFLMREARHNAVEMSFQVSDDTPMVAADQVQLLHVLMNLISNSIESLSVSEENHPREVVIVACQSTAGGLAVSVRDNGVGVLEQNFNKLFTPFFSTKIDGVGVGLAICRSIIEAHGGRIWAAADQHPGATFIFSLPQLGKVSI